MSMVNLDAAILHYCQAGLLRFLGGFVVADAELEPEDFGADFNGLGGDGWDIFRAAEDIDDLDLFSGGFCFGKGGVDVLAEDGLPGIVWVDGDDVVAYGLEILGDGVAWTERFG